MIQRAAGVVERKQAVKCYQFFSTVSWNGSMFLRKNWSASVLQPPSQMHLCIRQYHHAYRQYWWYDTIVSPTHDIVQEALWQIVILCSFFFHWAGKQIFFSFYIFIIFITSQMAPRKKTPSVSKKPNQRTMVARKNTQVKSPRGKFNVSEVVRIVFINAYCQQSRF